MMVEGHGIDMLDASISGSHEKVDSRISTFMVGGKYEAYARILPILEPLDSGTTHTGPSESSSTIKVVTNLFIKLEYGAYCRNDSHG